METLSKSLADALSEIADLDLVCLPGRRDGRPPSTLRLLRFVFSSALDSLRRRGRADVVVIGDFVLAYLAVLHRWLDRSSGIVVIVHGLDVLYASTPGFLPRLYALYVHVMTRLFRRMNIHVVANSDATAEVARSVGLRVTRVIPLAVDIPELERDHSTNRERDLVLFVGRLVPRKGACWFALEVLSRLEGTRMIVVGPATDPEEARAVSALPGVEYLGSVSDEALAAVRRRAWIAVVPNQPVCGGDIEGFGLTAAESAAAGCVVLGSDIDGLSDALSGGVGALLASDDADAWVRQVSEVQNWTPQQHQAFAHNARLALSERNSWQSVAAAVLATATGS